MEFSACILAPSTFPFWIALKESRMQIEQNFNFFPSKIIYKINSHTHKLVTFFNFSFSAFSSFSHFFDFLSKSLAANLFQRESSYITLLTISMDMSILLTNNSPLIVTLIFL